MEASSQDKEDYNKMLQLLRQLERHVADNNHEMGSEQARLECLKVVHRMGNLLKTPMEKLSECVFMPHQILCIRIALEMRVFDVLSSIPKGPAETMIELQHAKTMNGSTTRCPPPLDNQDTRTQDLLARIMRVLAAGGFIAEVGVEQYTATEVSRTLTEKATIAMFEHDFEVVIPTIAQTPAYLHYHAFSPNLALNTPFQFSKQSALPYFDWLLAHPSAHARFNASMQVNRHKRPFWATWFPWRERLFQGAGREEGWTAARGEGDEEVWFVDVGGNTGHDWREFRRLWLGDVGEEEGEEEEVVGKKQQVCESEQQRLVVLQDLGEVLGSIDVGSAARMREEGIRMQEHDFFTRQPIHGAHVYFEHFVLHDFPDEEACRILHNIASSMAPGRSRLLLNEIILPAREVPLPQALWDIHMMTLLGGKERNGSEGEKLVSSANEIEASVQLEIVKIWMPPFNQGEGIIELKRRL